MTASELRQMYIRFFVERGHQAISSASLLPDNDPSVLFTTAGMHPLIPYLLGTSHPLGKRLVNIQKCIRTCDIDAVGDATHLTFFEMLGNWSLGDYFKTEAIAMSYEFLTARLQIPGEKLAVTVFAGDDKISRDQETYSIWRGIGLNESQIFFYGREENWWGPAGVTGPCGPDSEIFYDTGRPACGIHCGPACHCGKYIEIWNNVFMAYFQNADGSFSLLSQQNVDTGMGLERILMVINGQSSVYQTELFSPIIARIEAMTGLPISAAHENSFRILSEHLRAAVFILGDAKAVKPANSEQGYILRRLIRRAIRHGKKIGADGLLCEIAEQIIWMYGEVYPELAVNKVHILSELRQETALFARTLDSGLKRAAKYFVDRPDHPQRSEPAVLSGELAFKLYDTYGFPIEFTQELAAEKGMSVDMAGFDRRFKEHQIISRRGSEEKFKGGMADHSDQTTRLHTATHLLNGALRKVLGEGIDQKGSNITSERLRFDFSFERRITEEELAQISGIVNEAIRKEINVVCEEHSVEDAQKSGAIGVFTQKYSERVKVYTIDGYSKEICGGPHVANTREVGCFRIIKEESSAAGVRRIKAVAGKDTIRHLS